MLDRFQEVEIESQILVGRFDNYDTFNTAFQLEVIEGYIRGKDRESIDWDRAEKMAKIMRLGNGRPRFG